MSPSSRSSPLAGNLARERDADTPSSQQRLMGWRGELEAAGPGPGQLPEWAGLSQDQEALLAALQVLARPT